MKKLTGCILGVLVASTLAQATVITYSNNPGSNSADFANGIVANGGGSITVLDFESIPLGPYTPTMYPGVTFSVSPSAIIADGYAGPGGSTAPQSTGEGLYDGSRHLYPAGDQGGVTAYQMSITFDSTVMAAGFFMIDYYNPSGSNPGTLQAWDGAAGTGNLIGSAATAPYNFQPNNKYFIGILSTDSNIKSITLSSSGFLGDGVFIDNVEYVPGSGAPEPGTWMMVAGGLIAALFLNRRQGSLDEQTESLSYLPVPVPFTGSLGKP